jgi:hypothetical protein
MATIKEILETKGYTQKRFPCMACGEIACSLGEPVCSNCIDKDAWVNCPRCGGSGKDGFGLPCVCKDHGDDERRSTNGT